MRLDNAKDCSIQKYLGTSSEYSIFGAIESSLKREGLLFYQTRSHAISSSTTHCQLFTLRKWYA